MTHKKITLPNGLRLVFVSMPSSPSVNVTVWTNVGSRYEDEKIAGLSHFLEHMVFKGSTKRPTAKLISEAVDGIGGEFNAGTSKEWTNFYIKASSANLSVTFDVLSDIILNPLILEEEVQREKGVILEEMAMYEDTPTMHIGDVFEETIFKGSTLGRDTIGTAKAIKSFRSVDFVKYRTHHYHPSNLLVTVAGGVREQDVIKLTKKYFGNLEKSNVKPKFKKFSHLQLKPQINLLSKKNEQAHFILGFRGNELGHPERYAESILAVILGGGMSSRLFSEVRERRGLAYSVRTDVDHYTDCGYMGTYAGVDPKKAEEAVKVILGEHYKIANKEKEITKEELKKAKEYIKGHIALSLENSSAVNRFFGEQELLRGKIETPHEVFEKLDKVILDEVYKVAKKFFKPQNLNLAIIGPYTNADTFKKIVN